MNIQHMREEKGKAAKRRKQRKDAVEEHAPVRVALGLYIQIDILFILCGSRAGLAMYLTCGPV